jgi:hypothetical protein
MLLQAAPETFYITDHYANYPMILVNLATVRRDALPDIVERARFLGMNAIVGCSIVDIGVSPYELD